MWSVRYQSMLHTFQIHSMLNIVEIWSEICAYYIPWHLQRWVRASNQRSHGTPADRPTSMFLLLVLYKSQVPCVKSTRSADLQ